MPAAVTIDHSAYPHIISRILTYADLETQNALARTSKAYYDAFDATARRHVVVRTRGDTVTIGTRVGGRHRRSMTVPYQKPSKYAPEQRNAFYKFLREGVTGSEVTDVEYPAHNMLTWGQFRAPGVARVHTLRVVATSCVPAHRLSHYAWSPLSTCDSLVVFSHINPPSSRATGDEPDADYYELVGEDYPKYVFNSRHRLVINIDIPPDAQQRPHRNRCQLLYNPRAGTTGDTDYRSEQVMVFRATGAHVRQQDPVRDPWWEPIALRLAKDIRASCRYTFVGADAFQPPMALGDNGEIVASFEDIVRGEHHKLHTQALDEEEEEPDAVEPTAPPTFDFVTRDQYRASVGEEQFAIDTGV
ncbi:uncharacterized protein LOC62_07G009597 [Vanrija pseudolonga]|uniref:Uncharacterized protein n=1 Tax=Vanrija pseudolonga TaxID=143232 RepID=A0AAF0YM93_9TREE|nr:hypothetical protein LOC62_07G009597 [Vanrija pseudolonga]